KRMAKSFGLADQKEVFRFKKGGTLRVVRADIDVDQFSASTIALLNLVALVHSKGLNVENFSRLIQQAPSPGFERQLLDDVLVKRNQHLTEQIQSNLSQSDNIMVPWGAAHMPGIAREIQKSGFRLTETREYAVIRFYGGIKNKASPVDDQFSH